MVEDTAKPTTESVTKESETQCQQEQVKINVIEEGLLQVVGTMEDENGNRNSTKYI